MSDLLTEQIQDAINKYGYSLEPSAVIELVRQKMVDEGWKSPPQAAADCTTAYSEGQFDERQVIGKWLKAKQNPDELWVKVWESDVDALLKGKGP
jgi:hypothetical protein